MSWKPTSNHPWRTRAGWAPNTVSAFGKQRKIPVADYPRIRARLEAGESAVDIAAEYGATVGAIYGSLRHSQR